MSSARKLPKKCCLHNTERSSRKKCVIPQKFVMANGKVINNRLPERTQDISKLVCQNFIGKLYD